VLQRLIRVSQHDDQSQPFQVEHCDARGRLVRLGPAIEAILDRHNYPEPVARLVAEAVALVATMATALKFTGIFTLQAKGDGPVSLLVADYRIGPEEAAGGLRGYASFNAEKLASWPTRADHTLPLLGKGYIAFTIDPGGEDSERYQGIVELEGTTLADAADAYFAQSEQLAVRLVLAARRVTDAAGARGWRAGGLMLQQLPTESVSRPDRLNAEERALAWEHVTAMAASTRPEELTSPALEPHELLYRLFHQDGVRVYDPIPLEARCTCNAERISGVLSSFTADEIAHISEKGAITVNCQFCNRNYRFDPDTLSPMP